ncbi:twin-arginine translocase TatA/TatE family subunit [Serinibacter arcticus]|uniref:Sec-independent protein translocase protein TatA n=1 Tax=Serinibacter arcticus TaxID=1655435 RepID=A0A4Z1E6U9_9MICO|nr:twin-arginine translocase TatA/TatE family subunit [Serinibacter arcticus]TGO06588.1 Twin-arginine translocation protein TatA [Serinibacter arcticus]
MRPQLWHIIVLLVVVLLVFGAAKLPDIARNVGKSAKILKEEVKDLRGDEPSNPTAPGAAPYTPPPAATTQPHVDPYAPGGTTPPGVSSPTDAPSSAPNAGPSEWPPGSSPR